MKEIGESFKEARETIGISKSEVIKDLNITESQLDNLEDGNANAFKDVFTFTVPLVAIPEVVVVIVVDGCVLDKYPVLTHPFTGLVILLHAPSVSTTFTAVPFLKELIIVPPAVALTFKFELCVATYLI